MLRLYIVFVKPLHSSQSAVCCGQFSVGSESPCTTRCLPLTSSLIFIFTLIQRAYRPLCSVIWYLPSVLSADAQEIVGR